MNTHSQIEGFPVYSHLLCTFDSLQLHPQLKYGLVDMGFKMPSRIQATTIPLLLADPPQNIIVQSQSGTGKSAAYILAMLSKVDASKKYPQVLCILPTYELAIQIGELAACLAKYYPEVQMIYAVQGEDPIRGTRIPHQVIIGTPGKIIDWIIKIRVFDIKKIKIFILDEADLMMNENGHLNPCAIIYRNLNPSCQVMFFSSTYDEESFEFAKGIVENPTAIQLRREDECLPNITQYYVCADDVSDKYNAMTEIYKVLCVGQAIVFCHTKKTVMWVAGQMKNEGYNVGVITADFPPVFRLYMLGRFKHGLIKVLVTTDVLSRGIDVPEVSMVVNYDIPMVRYGLPDYTTYLHRIGRTGRFGSHSVTITIIESKYTLFMLKLIEQHFKRAITHLNLKNINDLWKIRS